MPTNLQKNLAREIIENVKRKKPKNKKELVLSSGYGIKTATQQIPAVFEQKGVIDALNDFGFSVDNAKKVVGKILNDERVRPETRIRASEQVFKVHGTYAPDKSINLNIDLEPNEEVKKIAEEINALHRGTSQSGNGIIPSPVGKETQD